MYFQQESGGIDSGASKYKQRLMGGKSSLSHSVMYSVSVLEACAHQPYVCRPMAFAVYPEMTNQLLSLFLVCHPKYPVRADDGLPQA